MIHDRFHMALFGLDTTDAAVLGLWVAIGSAVFTVIAFLITFSRERKSEQIRIARDSFDYINKGYDKRLDYFIERPYSDDLKVEEKRKNIVGLLNIIVSIVNRLRYFSYMVKKKEIRDESVLNYYGYYMELKSVEDSLDFIDKEIGRDPDIVKTEIGKNITFNYNNARDTLSKVKNYWEKRQKPPPSELELTDS